MGTRGCSKSSVGKGKGKTSENWMGRLACKCTVVPMFSTRFTMSGTGSGWARSLSRSVGGAPAVGGRGKAKASWAECRGPGPKCSLGYYPEEFATMGVHGTTVGLGSGFS